MTKISQKQFGDKGNSLSLESEQDS